MKNNKIRLGSLCASLLLIAVYSFTSPVTPTQDVLTGAWIFYNTNILNDTTILSLRYGWTT